MTDYVEKALPLLGGLLVLLLAGWLYWPGQSGPVLLDDRSSITVIGDLKKNPELAWDYVKGDRSGPLGRPVSMASFVLEKLLLEDDTATSKRVNTLLHLVNGGLVIWLFWLLFGYLAVPGYRGLAVLLGAAWLLSPLYVSTVLYVVQRMAILSTAFMLLASISFVSWRSRLALGQFSPVLFLLIAANFTLAILAKENAVVLIPILLLVEALWFQFEDKSGAVIRGLRFCVLALIALGGLGLIFVLVADYDGLAAAFKHRPFTLEERLLTQSRVVWDYAGQIVTPDLSRMGLYHDDFTISHSLTDPITTLHAIVAWVAVCLLLLFSLRWVSGRYLALGILWFLLGHSVESTVLSLELYFEHRNYFPGIGLFLLVGTLFMLAVRRWPEVKSPLLAYLACLVIWLATMTGSQVQIWSSHPLVILSHLNGHPDSFRANADMAVQMANLGDLDAARQYSARAFDSSSFERQGDRGIRDLALACMAKQPVEPGQIERLGNADPRRPFSSVITVLTMVRLLQDNVCPGFDRLAFADRMAQLYIEPDSVATASANVYHSLAVLENSLQRWQYANLYIDSFLKFRPNNTRGLLMKLHFMTALGKVSEADAVTALLQKKNSEGKLTVGEQQTLSLYLEH